MIKRSLSILAIFLLAFTASVSAAKLPNLPSGSGEGKKDQQSILKLKQDDIGKNYKSNEKVRVIVEMKEAPAIEIASKEGKLFKQLSKTKKQQLKSEKLANQKKLKNKVKEKKIAFKELESFTTVVNGFSGEIQYGEIKKIEAMPEVAEVHIANEYERPVEKPDMIYSKELVQAQEAWREYGYKGEGMVIGIIDTGIDPSHRDMVLNEENKAELSESEVKGMKKSSHLLGNYFTPKVPYGYNYMDENEEILDLGEGASMHGMHVAGTAGANGDEAHGGIKGVAPEAQLLALKVFGNDPAMKTTWGDIYIKAIDDAIILGADVLNMSLGSTAGFVSEDDPEQQAVSRAVNNGILMSISAGNSAHFGNGFANPSASNPDIGVSGSPGLAYDSVQVASVENNFMDLDAVTYDIGGKEGKAPFMSASSVHPNALKEKTYDLAAAGIGTPEELAKVDVKGKFALIERGTLSFIDKAKNAQAAGAAGVIIFNNADGYISMATDASITIPQLFMLKSDGAKLKTTLTAGEKVKVSFNGDKTKSANPEAGKMSAFSSWGVAPNLDFKPEITAPGGQIYSTLNNDEYGMMSGTSMAAPHVSGGSALVLERVDKEFKLTGPARTNLAKNLMMNTSKPVKDQGVVNKAFGWENPYSPRRQGAGVMQLHSALSTPAVVTEANTKEAKVAMKEVGNTFAFKLKVENFSNKAVKYDVKGNIQTDYSFKGRLGYSAHQLEAQEIKDASIKINNKDTNKITVPAKKSVTFEVKVDISKGKVLGDDLQTLVDINKVFPNGYFVEGFVTLKDPADTNPELHVPYVGFKGEWDKAPILDGTKYEKESFYGVAGAVTTVGKDFDYLGYDPAADTFSSKRIAISPNGDGSQDDFVPLLSFLRNAKKVEYSILNSENKQVRKLRTENNVSKNYYDGGEGTAYTLDPARKWDGKVNNAFAKDGVYYFEIKALIDYKGAQWQTFKMPIRIDTVKPTVRISKKGNVLTIQGKDNLNGSGIAYYEVQVDGKSITEKPLPATSKQFTLPDLRGEKVQVVAIDNAGNKKVAETELAKDSAPIDNYAPAVKIKSPETLSVNNKSKIKITGEIEEASKIKEFKIDNQTVPVTYNKTNKKYEFSYEKKYADGVQSMTVKATDNWDNTVSFKKLFMVDTTKPGLKVKGVPATVGVKAKNPKVDVTVEDNFDEIRLYLNGSEVFYNEFKEPYKMRAFKKEIKKLELPLKSGNNKIEFKVTDLAGNESKKEFNIFKAKK
ncbi:S8 family serine peptidase [Peribacillus muralis]|uniref:S8 family serine peptidase n=1 Tax=Peribacillus muralis TaxID=264697 RepID=UPI000B00E96D|nr:S8 family serine peptidase [Peribacillus muralis]